MRVREWRVLGRATPGRAKRPCAYLAWSRKIRQKSWCGGRRSNSPRSPDNPAQGHGQVPTCPGLPQICAKRLRGTRREMQNVGRRTLCVGPWKSLVPEPCHQTGLTKESWSNADGSWPSFLKRGGRIERAAGLSRGRRVMFKAPRPRPRCSTAYLMQLLTNRNAVRGRC
jgi:hypothetical protein